jgi:hercynylcysteine S-oxide lyase
LQDLTEAAPDKFLRHQFDEYLLASRTAVAELLDAPVETCVFLQNATLGINTVLRNLVYKPGDVIVYFDTIYGACEKTIISIQETTPDVQARKVIDYEFPCDFDVVINKFEKTIEAIRQEGLNPKVAVFDTICSLPGVRFPFEQLTETCRRHKILSCIDGAHGVGQIQLDLRKLDPDFFVSNCHK